MLRISGAIAALILANASVAQAAGQATASDQPAVIQAAAEKSCNDALDRGNFEYNTMEDCVSDTTAKMQRAATQHASVTSPSSDQKSAHPN